MSKVHFAPTAKGMQILLDQARSQRTRLADNVLLAKQDHDAAVEAYRDSPAYEIEAESYCPFDESPAPSREWCLVVATSEALSEARQTLNDFDARTAAIRRRIRENR